jgi:hypothetical protein
MMTFEYKKLDQILNSVPPYRGTPNRFPLEGRRDLARYFLAQPEDGGTVFDVCYGYRWSRVEISKEEYNIKARKNAGDVSRLGDKYYVHVKDYNVIGRVRPDNTIQITADYMGQGTRKFLSENFRGWVSSDSRRGGVIHSMRKSWPDPFLYPLCKGMHIDAGTSLPVGDMRIYTKTIRRKAAKEYLGQWETFFKASYTMTAALSEGSIITSTGWRELVKDVNEQYVIPNLQNRNNYWFEFPQLSQKLKAIAKGIMNESPLDALTIFQFAYDTGRMRMIANDEKKYYGWKHVSPMTQYDLTMRRLKKDLYKDNPEVFNIKEYRPQDRYPATDWGVTVTIDGQEVEQYV